MPRQMNNYVETIFSHGYIPMITKPTRITDFSDTLIDHIYTNKNNLDCNLEYWSLIILEYFQF